jgi:hypothetical protein
MELELPQAPLLKALLPKALRNRRRRKTSEFCNKKSTFTTSAKLRGSRRELARSASRADFAAATQPTNSALSIDDQNSRRLWIAFGQSPRISFKSDTHRN